MADQQPEPQQPRGGGFPVLPFVAGMAIMLALVVGMVGGMAMWSGDHGGMMRQGSDGADQTPVVSSDAEVVVEMRNFAFYPAKLTVNAGAEVTWVNRDGVPHNAVADDSTFDTGRVDGDRSASATFDRPGTYSYVCTYHPGMKATVTVT